MGVGVKKVQISLVKPSCLNSQFFNSDEQIISGGGDLVGKGGEAIHLWMLSHFAR